MYQVVVKTWADGRLSFLQVRRSGKVVFGVIFDAAVPDHMRLVQRMADVIASTFGLSVDEVRNALQYRSR